MEVLQIPPGVAFQVSEIHQREADHQGVSAVHREEVHQRVQQVLEALDDPPKVVDPENHLEGVQMGGRENWL